MKVSVISLTLFLWLLSGSAAGQQSATPVISTPAQIRSDFAAVPCKNSERLNGAKLLFEKMGASPDAISIEKHKKIQNLVVRMPGASPEMIVVGAHYDKASQGCGAVDNWSGIVTIAHLFRTLRDLKLQKTILFVAFGEEEGGLFGSHAMVDAIRKEELEQYCTMINIDSLGLAQPQILDNTSSRKLAALTLDLAKEMKISVAHANIGEADADSSSFLKRKIPAITLHGLSRDYESVIHTRNDQASAVNELSVYLGYRLSLALVMRLDESSCGLFR